MDANTPGNVRSRYIGLWLFYGGIFAFFLGMVMMLADAYDLIAFDEMYANFGTYASYLLMVMGAFVALLGHLFRRS